MNCFECEQEGAQRTAVALCHCCSAALCSAHAHVVAQKLYRSEPVSKSVALPREAREVLCATCMAALHQPHLPMTT